MRATAPPPADPSARSIVHEPVGASPNQYAPPAIAKFRPRPSIGPRPAVVPAPQPGEIPLWRQPAVRAIAALVLRLFIGAGVHFLSINLQKMESAITTPQHAPGQPQDTQLALQI